MYTVPVYDASLARRQTNPKRVYCVDHALVTSVASGIVDESTRRRETKALFDAMVETGTESGTIVTRSESETIDVVPTSARSVDRTPAGRARRNG